MRHANSVRAVQAVLAAALAGGCGAAKAQDHADIDGTRIIGNRELPKVLYIVPWKKPLQGDLAARPPVSVLDEVLAPLDREVFRRQVRYGAQFDAGAAAGAAAPPVAAQAQ